MCISWSIHQIYINFFLLYTYFNAITHIYKQIWKFIVVNVKFQFLSNFLHQKFQILIQRCKHTKIYMTRRNFACWTRIWSVTDIVLRISKVIDVHDAFTVQKMLSFYLPIRADTNHFTMIGWFNWWHPITICICSDLCFMRY
jgi:hypothetical protein